MSLKELGDGAIKWWPILLACIGGIAVTAVAFAQLKDVTTRVEKAEARFERIEWYLVKIGTKMGVDFDR